MIGIFDITEWSSVLANSAGGITEIPWALNSTLYFPSGCSLDCSYLPQSLATTNAAPNLLVGTIDLSILPLAMVNLRSSMQFDFYTSPSQAVEHLDTLRGRGGGLACCMSCG
ncbi:hypothetical protein XU18_2803 [Perkinsela sp. CCAP 1560/4]|nr:hypothetical protein XU18_2803 [Perkinsela sp. CCAP 1560/4]|eukprot:KNH06298.1 hypothetical protein XU18_2803 [Perkinsela sp. CCAP 1560/4]